MRFLKLLQEIGKYGSDFLVFVSICNYFLIPICKFISFAKSYIDFSLVQIEDKDENGERLQRVCVRLRNCSNHNLSIQRIEWYSNYLPSEDLNWPINKCKNIVMKGRLLESGKEDFWCLLKWYPEKQHDYSSYGFQNTIKVYFKYGLITFGRKFTTDTVYTVNDLKNQEVLSNTYFQTSFLKRDS